MEIYNRLPEHTSPRVLVLGTFDGLHLGHMRIFKRAREKSNKLNIPLTVLTFEPSPEEYFNNIPASERRLLTRIDKLNIMKDLGVDVVYELEFDESIINYAPEEFVENILLERLQARAICVGYDFKFGRRRCGDTELLQAYRSDSLDVEIISPFKKYGEPVSSSRIRKLIRSADMRRARKLLGRPYVVRETYRRGQGRGKSLGFPTINFSFTRTIRPRPGVYSVWLGREQRIPAVANFGVHPTVSELDEPVLEVHTLVEPPDIKPGAQMHTYFERFIRREEKFSSLEELREAMTRDVNQAAEQFEDLEKPGVIHENNLEVD